MEVLTIRSRPKQVLESDPTPRVRIHRDIYLERYMGPEGVSYRRPKVTVRRVLSLSVFGIVENPGSESWVCRSIRNVK